MKERKRERERTTAPREYTSREKDKWSSEWTRRKRRGEREKLPAEVSEWKRECAPLNSYSASKAEAAAGPEGIV